MAAPGAGSLKRCPQCGALAALNMPVCATCGRPYRGTIGRGAVDASAGVIAGPPPISAPPLPNMAEVEEVSAGNRLSAVLVCVFVVGIAGMAIAGSSLRKASGASAATATRVMVVASTLSLFRNVGNASEYEATITLRNDGPVPIALVRANIRAYDANGTLAYERRDAEIFRAPVRDGSIALGASFTPPSGLGHVFVADRDGRPIKLAVEITRAEPWTDDL